MLRPTERARPDLIVDATVKARLRLRLESRWHTTRTSWAKNMRSATGSSTKLSKRHPRTPTPTGSLGVRSAARLGAAHAHRRRQTRDCDPTVEQPPLRSPSRSSRKLRRRPSRARSAKLAQRLPFQRVRRAHGLPLRRAKGCHHSGVRRRIVHSRGRHGLPACAQPLILHICNGISHERACVGVSLTKAGVTAWNEWHKPIWFARATPRLRRGRARGFSRATRRHLVQQDLPPRQEESRDERQNQPRGERYSGQKVSPLQLLGGHVVSYCEKKRDAKLFGTESKMAIRASTPDFGVPLTTAPATSTGLRLYRRLLHSHGSEASFRQCHQGIHRWSDGGQHLSEMIFGTTVTRDPAVSRRIKLKCETPCEPTEYCENRECHPKKVVGALVGPTASWKCLGTRGGLQMRRVSWLNIRVMGRMQTIRSRKSLQLGRNAFARTRTIPATRSTTSGTRSDGRRGGNANLEKRSMAYVTSTRAI